MTPKVFKFIFCIRVSKICRISCWFQILGHNEKSTHRKSNLPKTFARWLYRTFFAYNFFVSKFFQHFQNQRKILRCFDTHIQMLWRKICMVKLKLFKNFFKAKFTSNGSEFWKCFLQKFLIIIFYTYKPVNPYYFLKNIIIAVPYWTPPFTEP
jgi:hypothetical protein